MSAKENKEAGRRMIDILNSAGGDLTKFAAIFEYYSPDFIFHSKQGDMNLEQYKKYTISNVSAFPDFNWKINHQVNEDDFSVLHYTNTATHTGTYQGIAPTGKKIKADGMNISRWSGGKIVEVWSVFDNLTMMTQLGLIPDQTKKK
jgi:predicted ester cyclase